MSMMAIFAPPEAPFDVSDRFEAAGAVLEAIKAQHENFKQMDFDPAEMGWPSAAELEGWEKAAAAADTEEKKKAVNDAVCGCIAKFPTVAKLGQAPKKARRRLTVTKG